MGFHRGHPVVFYHMLTNLRSNIINDGYLPHQRSRKVHVPLGTLVDGLVIIMATSNSSFGSAISVGTAEMRPLSPRKPLVTNISGPAMTAQSAAELLEQHRLPSPPRFQDSLPVSPMSQHTVHHLRCPPEPGEERRSIIDPSTVRLSFVGSITDLSQPLAMPLETGFQKLYKLYEQ